MSNLIIFDKKTNICKSIITGCIVESIVIDDDIFSIEISDDDLILLKDKNGLIIFKNDKIESLKKPSRFHEYDPLKKEWVENIQLKNEILSDEVRDLRLYYLKELDSLVQNPIRYEGFTEQEKNKLKQYRLDLLNVPQQEGFPLNVIFPDKPV